MKFVCDRCQTKYSIADDKVRGKVLKVRCKTCQNVITVREAGVRPSVGGLAPVRASQRPSSAAVPVLSASGAEGERDEQSERTSIAPAPAGFMAELVPGRRATPPPPPPLGDRIEWFLALDGAQQGPFARKVLVDRLLALPKDADVHVWNEGMAGWKPPRDVPDVARDLVARRPPVVPVRPPVPRTTPSPPVPPLAARRGPTQPLSTGVASKLPAPTASQSHAHAVPVPHAHGEDPASQPTPPPAAPGKGKETKRRNGVGAHASSPVAAFPGVESDAMSALNLGARARAPSGPLRLMEVAEATSWSGAGRVSEGRHRGTKMAVGLLALVGVMIGILMLNSKKAGVTQLPTAKGGLDSEALGKLAETVSKEKSEPPKAGPTIIPEAPATAAPEARGGGKGTRGHLAARGRPAASHVGTTPAASTGGAAVAPAEDPNAARFRETGGRPVVPTATVSNRPAPSQGEISRVIANNKAGIKTCYQRALLRDSSLTHGKIVVGVSIGISGRVKSVHVDGPTSFRALEPCIKEMLARWVFPQSYEEYGTEFSYVFQGNE
jgi:predicted Zn finger-like uncharacterized protein